MLSNAKAFCFQHFRRYSCIANTTGIALSMRVLPLSPLLEGSVECFQNPCLVNLRQTFPR